jgi:hypothetical protein
MSRHDFTRYPGYGLYKGGKMTASEKRPAITGYAIAAAGILVLGVALRVAYFSPLDIMHPDELMQYLEQANRLATGHGIVPWEARFGLRNALIEQFLALFLWIGHKLSPDTLFAMYLARAAFAALTLLVLPAAWQLGALASRRHALVALFVAAVWWESVLFSELLLSESLGAALLLLAAAPLLQRHDAQAKALCWSGFLLCLGVMIRLQYAPFAAVLALGALGFDWQRWKPVLLGAIAAAVIGMTSDLAMGRVPFAWAFVNVFMNVGQDIASRFGVSGPQAYVSWLYIHLAPVMVPVVVAAFFAGRRYWPLLGAALVNIAVHSAIGHKEYRFIWLSALTLLVLAAIATIHLADRIAARRRTAGTTVGSLGVAAVCLAWLTISLFSEHLTGGFNAFRGGGAIPRLAIAAAMRPGVCGIAIADEFNTHVVPAMMPPGSAISVAPVGVLDGKRPLPADLAASVNALVMEERPRGAEAYHKVSCLPLGHEQPCLYVRSGTCTPSVSRWSFQASVNRQKR